MPEPFWTPYARHRAVLDRSDRLQEEDHDYRLAVEAESYFSREGVRDCV